MAIPATNLITATFGKKYISDYGGGSKPFEIALHTIEAGIQAGKIWNQEFQDAKSNVSSGCEHAQHIASSFATNKSRRGSYYDCRDNIGYAFGMNQAAKMSRELKKLGKKNPDILTSGITAYIETLDQIDAIWKWLQSVKPIIVKGRRPNENKTEAQIAIELRNTGLCAICDCRQKLDEGKMVMHGYTMSDYNHSGYRVGKCFGVKYSCYELSNEANVAYAPVLTSQLKGYKSALKTLKSGTIETLTVKRDTYVDHKRAAVNVTLLKGTEEFDRELAGQISQLERFIGYTKSDIAENDAKIANWTLQPLKYGR